MTRIKSLKIRKINLSESSLIFLRVLKLNCVSMSFLSQEFSLSSVWSYLNPFEDILYFRSIWSYSVVRDIPYFTGWYRSPGYGTLTELPRFGQPVLSGDPSRCFRLTDVVHPDLLLEQHFVSSTRLYKTDLFSQSSLTLIFVSSRLVKHVIILDFHQLKSNKLTITPSFSFLSGMPKKNK